MTDAANVDAYQRWACCGPDFQNWIRVGTVYERRLAELFAEQGELRVRYAGLILEGLNLRKDAEADDILRQACREKWMAPATLRWLSRVHLEQGFPPIPWLDRYLRTVEPGMIDLVSKAAEVSCYGPPNAGLPPFLFDEETIKPQRRPNLDTLLAEQILTRTYRLHPDFEGDTVLCWLSYIRYGADDPLLSGPHARYRPQQHHQGY